MAKMVRQRQFQIVFILFVLGVLLLTTGCSEPKRKSSLVITPPDSVTRALLCQSGSIDYHSLERSLIAGGMKSSYAKYWTGIVALRRGDHTSAESLISESIKGRMEHVYILSGEMCLGDIMFIKGEYANALKVYSKVNQQSANHIKFLSSARLCATYFKMADTVNSSSCFLAWKDEFREITTSFATSRQVANCLQNDLSANASFELQAGFFSREDLANNLRNRINGIGQRARVVHDSRGYRVIVGPYPGRNEAVRAASELKHRGIEAFIMGRGEE